MNCDLRAFYAMTMATRAGVLDWLDGLPEGVLTKRDDRFAFGSLAAIFSHVADTYVGWVGTVGLGDPDERIEATTVRALRAAFHRVDATVARALEAFAATDEPVARIDPGSGETWRYDRRWLILHPITHEFHHKGQALALARVLGHPHHGSPDTDLLPPQPQPSSN